MEYRDEDFSGQDVRLNDNIFTGCTFRNCRIIYAGTGPVTLAACRFDENVEWLLDRAATATIHYLTTLYHTPETGRKLVEELFEKIRRGE
jgi:hypothetical protein